VTAALVYVLCVMTSGLCAMLLLRQYRRSGQRSLMWSGLSFVGFAISNVLVFADLVIWPNVDLALIRALAGLGSVSILIYGLTLED
jgi:hypothetical protein